MFNLLP